MNKLHFGTYSPQSVNNLSSLEGEVSDLLFVPMGVLTGLITSVTSVSPNMLWEAEKV